MPDGRGVAAGVLAAGVSLSGASAAGAAPDQNGPVSRVEAAVQEAAEQAAAEEAAAEEAERAAAQAANQDAASEDARSTTTGGSDDASDASSSDSGPARDESGSDSAPSSGPAAQDEDKEEEPQAARSTSGILGTARAHVGTPYSFGGSSPSGWDCSGFTQWVYAQHGISLPHSASAQGAGGTRISKSEAQPGDLVVSSGGGHVGIYAGGDQFVDAGNSRVDTSERDIYSGSWYYVTYRY